MAHQIDFYGLSAAQIGKIRKSEGAAGVRRRCDEMGEHLATLNLTDHPSELLDPLDHLLGTRLQEMLGADLGDLDGTQTDPKVGYLCDDDVTDAIDALDRLVEAIEFDPDEEDDEDYDRVQLMELRSRAEELAEDLGLTFDDDFVDMVSELVENLKAARDEDLEMVTFVSSG